MRRFHNNKFPSGLAEALDSVHLDIPSEEEKEALDYVKQFLEYHSGGGGVLHRGYIPEKYLDALVEIRDANSNRYFSSAVEQLGVDGETSEEVTQYDNFKVLEIESSFDTIEELSSVYYQLDSDEARKNLRTLQDLMRNVRFGNTIRMYLPEESYNQITSNLSANLL